MYSDNVHRKTDFRTPEIVGILLYNFPKFYTFSNGRPFIGSLLYVFFYSGRVSSQFFNSSPVLPYFRPVSPLYIIFISTTLKYCPTYLLIPFPPYILLKIQRPNPFTQLRPHCEVLLFLLLSPLLDLLSYQYFVIL